MGTKYIILTFWLTGVYSLNKHEYDRYEIRDLISMINVDNNPSTSVRPTTAPNNNVIIRKIQGYVLVGFIKFTEGYYMILVTKQLPVAILGYHVIYTIEDVAMIYIPYIQDRNSIKDTNLDEQK